jgi:hypothetical protein
MSEQTQCDNCGAVLLAEDLFCGECGAPRRSLDEVIESVTGEEQAKVEQPVKVIAPPPKPPKPRPSMASAIPSADSPRSGWRVAVILLITLGVLACIVALVAFVVFGRMEGEDTTPAEDWLFSAFCCLLPIGAIGAVFLGTGVFFWFRRLRNR